MRLLLAILSACLLAAGNLHAATEIPFRYADGMIWVKLAVAGESVPLNFLVDSGAGASVLDLGTARRLGVKLGRSENVQGVSGRAVAYRVQDFPATIASVTIPRSVLALDLSGVNSSLHQRLDGLLGADFFRGRIVQIDYKRERIRILGQDELNATNAEVLRLARRNDALCVSVSVAAQKPRWMRVDTGCNTALEWVATDSEARQAAASSIGLAERGPERHVSTSLQLGSTRLDSVRAGIRARQIFPGEAGLLGNGVLSKFTVTFDGIKNRLILAKQ